MLNKLSFTLIALLLLTSCFDKKPGPEEKPNPIEEKPGSSEKKPDLIPERFDVTWNNTTKEAVLVVKNIGEARAGKFDIYLEINANPVIQDGDKRIYDNKTIMSLDVDEERRLVYNLDPTNSLRNVNVYNVYVEVDSGKVYNVDESNETNNKKTVPL